MSVEQGQVILLKVARLLIVLALCAVASSLPAYFLSASAPAMIHGDVKSSSIKLEVFDAGVGHLDAVKFLSVASSTVHLDETCIISSKEEGAAIESIELRPGTYHITLTEDINLQIFADAASSIRLRGLQGWSGHSPDCSKFGPNPIVASVVVDLAIPQEAAATAPIAQMVVETLKPAVGLLRIQFHDRELGTNYSTVLEGRIVNAQEIRTELSPLDKVQSVLKAGGLLKMLKIEPDGIRTVFSGTFESLRFGANNMVELVPSWRQRINGSWFFGVFFACFSTFVWFAKQLGALR